MTDTTPPRVFLLDAHCDMGLSHTVVGSKAANLARLTALGLRIPPAIAISTSIGQTGLTEAGLRPDVRSEIEAAIRLLEAATGLTMGQRDPLLVSVRSSPPVSMPGMLETLLNVGLTPGGVPGLTRRTGNPWLAWDALRRLTRSFAETVYGLDAGPLDQLAVERLTAAGARTLQELDPLALRDLARDSASLGQTIGVRVPADPVEQVIVSVEAVLRSWNSPRAREYRRMNGIDERTGTGVLVQAMVFGNAGGRSGSGVGFTRNPASGEDQLYVDFLFNAQGEDVVSGRQPIFEGALLPDVLPAVWTELLEAKSALEREFGDMQDFEFTVSDGRLFFLQTRAGKRSPLAALRIATDLVGAEIIDSDTAVDRLKAYDLDRIEHVTVEGAGPDSLIARATPAGVGVATGRLAFDSQRALRLAAHDAVILARREITTDDISGLAATVGIVTTLGGRTSHAAVVARQMEKVCLVGCADLSVDERARRCSFGDRIFREGEVISLDGETGAVYAGEVAVVRQRPLEALAKVESWRRAAHPDGELRPAPSTLSDFT
ncbi:MAG TPA: PEP/pyruvate-binding domain-containing protein [Vicinamibacterales bacterium]|nr:PEP/pyruvate-binding domain-containing protein [Vicinamibacterales bacterium]